MSNLSAQVASVSDRDNLIFEIWFGDKQVAEISKEPGLDYAIDIFPAPNGSSWHFDLREFKALIEHGIKELASNQ